MIHNYSVEIHNIDANRWEIAETARTEDEAFSKAEKYIGFHKSYDTVAILDMQGFVIWESDKPLTRMKNVGLEAQQESEYVAPDGSV